MLFASPDMNVDTHLNIAGIPDILLVCGIGAQRPDLQFSAGQQKAHMSGRRQRHREGERDMSPLRERRERQGVMQGFYDSFRTRCPSCSSICTGGIDPA